MTGGASAAPGAAGDAEPDGRATPASGWDSGSPRSIALEEPARDGRVARGQRTRRNVAEALMALLRAGDSDPTAKAVARRAGVSLRLVFHHFADMDDLYQFVGALLLRRQWAEMPQLSPKLSLPTRIERTVAHRAALFEETSEVRRALACRAPTCSRRRAGVGRLRQPVPRGPEGHLRPRADGTAGEQPGRVSRGDGRRHVVGGLGSVAHDVGRPGARGPTGDVPHAGGALRRLPRTTGVPGQPSDRRRGLRSQASGSSAMRRRTSSTAGAG